MNEEEQKKAQEEQEKIQDEQAADSTKRVLSTAAKGAATAMAGPEAAAAIDAVEKIPIVDAVERGIAKGVNEIASKIDPNAKKKLAENNDKIAVATNIADSTITLGTSDPSKATKFSEGTPENINLDNSGYNPNFKQQEASREIQAEGNNLDNLNRELSSNKVADGSSNTNEESLSEAPNNDLNELSENNSKENNVEDEGEGKLKIPIVVIILLPVIGVLFLIAIVFLPMFYGELNDENNYEYEYASLSTCGRVIFLEDLAKYQDELDEIDKKITKAIKNNDSDEVAKLKKEKYNLLPSKTIDEYVAGVIQHEVGGFVDDRVYTAFALAVRTYLFRNSSIEENFCYISNSANAQTYMDPTSEQIKEIVAKTHDYILVDNNNNYLSTEYDAFCLASKDDNFYYIKQRNQAMRIKWVDKTMADHGAPASWKEIECAGGHGRGMSQYGAYYLATVQEYGWKDIIVFYYGDNIDIKRVNIIDMEKDGTILNAAVGEINGNLPLSASGFAWPLANITRCSSPFGWRSLGGGSYHKGLDLPQAFGTPVYAATSGRVVNAYDSPLCSNVGKYNLSCPGAGGYGSLGNHVIIEDANGVQTIYGHMKQGSITVFQGQQVTQGTKIGEVASSGSSTGYHLHFGVRVNKAYQNPYNYLSGLPASCGG